MNSRKNHLMLCLLGGMMLTGLTACSGDDDTTVTKENEKETIENEVKVRRLTITETDNSTAEAKQAITRASLTEGDGLTASWTAGDRLTYCNLMRTQYNGNAYDPIFGNLTASYTAATSQFTGDVSCYAGDYLAVVYPATTFTMNDSYTISLTGQDGTLDKLATTYHCVYGRATVTSVTGTTATATMNKMKSLLTVCKFSFVDRATSSTIPIKSLSISYSTSDSQDETYPQTATVAVKESSTIKDQADVHAAGVAGDIEKGDGPLTITCSSEQDAVYVALLPTAAQSTFNFTVTNASGTYTGTANAWLKEGEYVAATGLKLTKQQQQ